MQRASSLGKTLMLGKLEGKRRRGGKGWDGWMASLTQWTWVWANSKDGKGQGIWCASVRGAAKSQTQPSSWTTTRCDRGRVGSSNPHVDVWSPYLPEWNKTKGASSIHVSMMHPRKILLGSQIFQRCWWAMHLVSVLETRASFIWTIVSSSKKKKKPGKCSASLFDASELFSPMLCVDAMYNLCAGRILECPFIIVQTDYHYRFLRPAEKASSFVGPELKHLPWQVISFLGFTSLLNESRFTE